MAVIKIFLFEDQMGEEIICDIKTLSSHFSVYKEEEYEKHNNDDDNNNDIVLITLKSSANDAYETVKNRADFDLYLLDNSYEGKDIPETLVHDFNYDYFGVEGLLPLANEINPTSYKVILTGAGTGEDNELLKLALSNGADMWFEKPLPNDSFLGCLLMAIQKKKKLNTNNERDYKNSVINRVELDNYLPKEVKESYVGNHPKIVNMLKEVSILLERNKNDAILLTGESGVGKTAFAKLIHKMDKSREKKPFLFISCSAKNETTIRSELFGYKKGSFTDAYEDRVGALMEANGGTVFLDEINHTSVNFQESLLAAIGEKKISRIGEAEKTHSIDNVRFVVASSEDLDYLVSQGKFVKDLRNRLITFSYVIPPLRERKNDIPILVNKFLRRYNKQANTQISFSDNCLKNMCNYSWPANVRELEAAINRITSISENINAVIEWEEFKKGLLGEHNDKQKSSHIENSNNESILVKAINFIEELVNNNNTIVLNKWKNDCQMNKGSESLPRNALLYYLYRYGLNNEDAKIFIKSNGEFLDTRALEKYYRDYCGNMEAAKKEAQEIFFSLF